MKIYILFFIFVSVEATSDSKKCSFMILANCARDRNKFAKEHEFPIPTNEKEIAKQCEIFEEVRNCVINFGNSCMTSMDKIVGGFILSRSNQEMMDFCNPDHQSHKDYLEEIACIKNNFGHVSPCYKDKLAALEYMYDDASAGNRLGVFCCGLNRLGRCLLDPFVNKCDKNVTVLMEMQLLNFILSEWVVEMCHPYSLEKCPPLPTKSEYRDQYKNHYFIDYLTPYTKQ